MSHSPTRPGLVRPNNTPITVASADIRKTSNAKTNLFLPYIAYRRSSSMTVQKGGDATHERCGTCDRVIQYVPCVVTICTAMLVFCPWKNLAQLLSFQYQLRMSVNEHIQLMNINQYSTSNDEDLLVPYLGDGVA